MKYKIKQKQHKINKNNIKISKISAAAIAAEYFYSIWRYKNIKK